MLVLEQLSPDNRKVVARARRLERFLTQPFFTTEQKSPDIRQAGSFRRQDANASSTTNSRNIPESAL